MSVTSWPLQEDGVIVSQDLFFNFLDQLYTGEGVLHTNDLAVTADTDGIGVKIAPGGCVLAYDSVFGGKRVFFSTLEEKSGPNEHPNPSFAVNTSLWSVVGAATLTRDTGTFNSTPASGKIATSGASTYTQGIKNANAACRVNSSEDQIVGCWFNAPVGTSVKILVTEYNSAGTAGLTHETIDTGLGVWTKIEVAFTAAATCKFISTQILVNAAGSVNVFVDDFTLSRNFHWIQSFEIADPTNPRIDRLVVQILDKNVAGSSDATVGSKFRVISGTPTSGATLGNLTGAAAVPANTYLLANVLVPAAATSITGVNIDTTVRAVVAINVVIPPTPAFTTLDVFTVSQAWNKPAGAKAFKVVVIAGGGGGANGQSGASLTDRGGGSGGGGGALAERTFDAADITSPVTITVAVAASAGAAGGPSSFGTYLKAYGGGTGAAGAATDRAGGGGGGWRSVGGNGATGNVGGGSGGLPGGCSSPNAGGGGDFGGGGGGSGRHGDAGANSPGGGDSSYGGGGGAGGGGTDSTNAGKSGGVGGDSSEEGGGSAGSSGAAGGNGGAGDTTKCGGGGGGGAGTNTGTPGKGGNGGAPGGGGGGGGSGTTGGAGGTGGRGEVRVITFY